MQIINKMMMQACIRTPNKKNPVVLQESTAIISSPISTGQRFCFAISSEESHYFSYFNYLDK